MRARRENERIPTEPKRPIRFTFGKTVKLGDNRRKVRKTKPVLDDFKA